MDIIGSKYLNVDNYIFFKKENVLLKDIFKNFFKKLCNIGRECDKIEIIVFLVNDCKRGVK